MGWELRRTCAAIADITAPAHGALDLGSADSIAAAVHESRPDLILNAAAYTAVDKAESQPELAMAINGTAPGLLAQAADRAGAALVHYSTDYVFDGRKAGAYVEDDDVAPLNVYGRTKLAGERAIAATGCPHLIFRTSWVYGPRGQNFFLTMRRLARERKELRVVDDQVGAPTPAHFIAEATAEAIGKSISGGALDRERFRETGGLYHMTAGGSTSWHGFATEILRDMPGAATLHPIPASEYPTPAVRPANSVLDNARLERELGIRLPDWRAGLAWCLRNLETADYRT